MFSLCMTENKGHRSLHMSALLRCSRPWTGIALVEYIYGSCRPQQHHRMVFRHKHLKVELLYGNHISTACTPAGLLGSGVVARNGASPLAQN